MEEYDVGDDYIVRNGRKMVQGSPTSDVRQYMPAPLSRPSVPYRGGSPGIPGPPLTPGGSVGRTQPLRRPQQEHPDAVHDYERGLDESNAQLENLEAQEVLRKGLYGPHDALDLLYKAATDR